MPLLCTMYMIITAYNYLHRTGGILKTEAHRPSLIIMLSIAKSNVTVLKHIISYDKCCQPNLRYYVISVMLLNAYCSLADIPMGRFGVRNFNINIIII